MTVSESIDEVVQSLPEERQRELLDYAQFLRWRDERDDWRRFGQSKFDKAYGPYEPEYTEADLEPTTDAKGVSDASSLL
jgi:hypothetical protein